MRNTITLACSLIIAIVATSVVHGAPLDLGNQVFGQALSAALHEMLQDEVGSTGFKAINEKWFGGPSVVRKPIETCGTTTYPDISQVEPGTLFREILYSSHQVLIGSTIPNIPKRFNFTAVGTRNGITYGTTVGFESDIASSVFDRIAAHYAVDPIATYWVASKWFANATDNIVYGLFQGDFDIILAGMSIDGTWVDPLNPLLTKDRTDLMAFSCPYQDDGEAAVKGPRPLPGSARNITTASDMNQLGLIVCVHKGTSMAAYATANLDLSTIVEFENGPDVKNATLYGECHIYLAPVINAAWDAESSEDLSLAVTYYPSDKPLAIALRKDAPGPDPSSATAPAISLVATFLVLLGTLIL